jgi:hypothetical protein
MILAALLLAVAPLASADNCDIAQRPAATLLLPYFEVDVHARDKTIAETDTSYTIVNVKAAPAIARTTLWTDWGYPVLSFNTFLTGYDAQTIDLYDVLARGNTGVSSSGFPDACAHPEQQVSGLAILAAEPMLTLGTGATACGMRRVGGTHIHAIGYATVDVVSTCDTTLPTDPEYFKHDLLFDNVLTGDFAQVEALANRAYASPLVHIRALPEGGEAGVNIPSTLGRSFYQRLTPAGSVPTMDRRQPLPAQFAARVDHLDDTLVVWREPRLSTCAADANRNMSISNIVRFDEHENPTVAGGSVILLPLPPVGLPAASANQLQSGLFPPPSTSGDTRGWLYLNLHDTFSDDRPSQNWVLVRSQPGTRTRAIDATPLADGCAPIVAPGVLPEQ